LAAKLPPCAVAATRDRYALRRHPVSAVDVLGMQRVDASHGGVVLGVLPIATALVAVTHP